MRKRYVKAIVLDNKNYEGVIEKGQTVVLDLHSVYGEFDQTRTDYMPTCRIKGNTTSVFALQRFGIDPVAK